MICKTPTEVLMHDAIVLLVECLTKYTNHFFGDEYSPACPANKEVWGDEIGECDCSYRHNKAALDAAQPFL